MARGIDRPLSLNIRQQLLYETRHYLQKTTEATVMTQKVEHIAHSAQAEERIFEVRRSLNFRIPDEAWIDYTESDLAENEVSAVPLPYSRLYSSFALNGVGFHCIAIETQMSADGLLTARDEAWEEELSELYSAHGCDGILQTMKIRDRHYAVFAFPFRR